MKHLKKFNEANEEPNYMFWGNLEYMKTTIDSLLSMNKEEVNALLDNGHDWAIDHIATSKDDIEEVAAFLQGPKKGRQI